MNFIDLTKDKFGLRYKKNFARELSGTINFIQNMLSYKFNRKMF